MPMLNIAEYFPITDPTLIFFVVLLIILFAPIIMGKLRIPHIIGMVLAGGNQSIGSHDEFFQYFFNTNRSEWYWRACLSANTV